MSSGVGRVSDVVVPFTTPATPAAAPGAPVFTTQPSIFAATGPFAGTYTADDGAATGVMQYTRRWLLDGAPIGRGKRISPTQSGSLTFEVTAYGVAGVSTVATSAALQIAAGGAVAVPALPTGLAYRWSADDLPVQADNTAVASWTDSVAGLAVTQATAAAQPKYRTARQGSKPSVQFSGSQVLGAGSNAAMTALFGSDYTMVMVAKGIAGGNSHFGGMGLGVLLSGQATKVGSGNLQISYGLSTLTSLGVTKTGGVHIQGARVIPNAAGTATGTFSIGGSADLAYAYGTFECFDWLVWPRSLTNIEMKAVQAWIAYKYGQPTPWAAAGKFIAIPGDSLPAGTSADGPDYYYPTIMAQNLSLPWGTWENLGVAGSKVSNIAGRKAEVLDLPAKLGVPVTVCTFEWVNSVQGGDVSSANVVYQQWKTLLTEFKTAGIKVVFGTSTDTALTGYTGVDETSRAAYNALFDNASNRVGIIDSYVPIHNDAKIGVSGAASNATYFEQNQRLHLTGNLGDSGYRVLAGLMGSGVQAV